METSSLGEILRRPVGSLQHLEAERLSWRQLPWRAWGGLAGIAVGGSVLYGASLSLVLPRWRARGGGLWLALSAGLAWLVFGPALLLMGRIRIPSGAQAALVTIAYGEGILLIAALANLVRRLTGQPAFCDPARLNWGWVGLSNVVMALTLARQARALGVPAGKTLATWVVALDGSGALFAWLLRELPRGRV